MRKLNQIEFAKSKVMRYSLNLKELVCMGFVQPCLFPSLHEKQLYEKVHIRLVRFYCRLLE